MKRGDVCLTVLVRVSSTFLKYVLACLAAQVIIGLRGTYFHVAAIFDGSHARLVDGLLYSAPPFAPLLFPNLAALATIGVWDLINKDE